VAAVYIPTGTGKEHQTLYGYDGRDRLSTITQQLCTISSGHSCSTATATGANTYLYDGNDSRTQVTEDNGSGATTRFYCHDARNQLIGVYSATGCSTGLLEAYAYDAAGNRTSAAGRISTYSTSGQLATCSGAPACTPTFDADGRLTRITTLASGTWSYLYDSESRLVSACQSTSCTGSGFARFDSTYDGEGHRIRLVETPASGSATTTDFRYQGDAVASEVSTTGATVITRTFTTDESGAIIKVAVAGDPIALHNGEYLVTWNGHGDALALSKINGDGTLTAANRFTYSTWGSPSVSTPNGYGDLRFRYLYVGRFDVQWDHSAVVQAGLLYMHARHYSPEFGRFLQPDPAAAETNLYGYAENSPVTKVDPSGTCGQCTRIIDLLQKLGSVAQRAGTSLVNFFKAAPHYGRKLDYLFGKATGAQHNLDRSRSMALLLKSVGIVDNPGGRALVQRHLTMAWRTSTNVKSVVLGFRNSSIVEKESLLWGPNGAVKVVSIWQTYGTSVRLVTAILIKSGHR